MSDDNSNDALAKAVAMNRKLLGLPPQPTLTPTLTRERLEDQVRETPLLERLNQSQSRIGTMCSERRGPRLSIPVRAVDDDFYICTTLRDAASTIARLERELAHEVAQNNIAGEQLVTMADNFERAKALIGAGNAVSQLAAMTQERDEAVETGRQNAVKYAEAKARLQARIVQLETDADAVAWNVSPAMAQATIDQLNEQLTEMQARLVESEKAAYDVAGTIDHMKALLAEREGEIIRKAMQEARVQLAGCLMAAEGHNNEPAKQGDYGWSVSYQQTLNLRISYDAAMLELERLRERVDELEGRLNHWTFERYQQLEAERDALNVTCLELAERATELEGDFLIVTEQRLALVKERDAAVAEAGRLREHVQELESARRLTLGTPVVSSLDRVVSVTWPDGVDAALITRELLDLLVAAKQESQRVGGSV